ncbi:MAG TPA: acyl-CoA dehydrogenase family protein, partial [Acidimicrobiales bacterium]|nr:acyl-CoA dehydrogenase family protein [Acidimicrobiales bacterium]
MDLSLPGEHYPFRRQVRAWLEAHPRPSGRELAEAGYVVPHWPRPWGLDASPVDQLVLDEELRRAGVSRPVNPVGLGWAGPTLLVAGTEEQRRRFLPPMISGEELWCQLFSEPGAGSDLASLSTRAERVGDAYVVSGHKTWTSLAHLARFGILLARTDPEAPRHRGLSYLVCPMDAEGVRVVPLRDMTGACLFCQVFLDGVLLPADHLVGAEGQGWSLARVTLANERVSLSAEGALWGRGPTAGDLVRLVASSGGAEGPARQRLCQLWV